MNNHGKIRIKIDDLLEKNQLSKNAICYRAQMQRTQLNNYANNHVARLEVDVLARLCNAFQCEISDLLEYIPAEEEPTQN